MMSKFNSPDLNAPRFRAKSKKVLTKDLYKNFLVKYPTYNISYESFKEIIITFNTKVCDKVIENREGVELLEGLGILIIGAFKNTGKRLNVDYKASVKYGTLIQHRNLNSNGFSCKIFFTNYTIKFKLKNRSFWKFKPHRNFKRKVSREFSENYNKYVIVNNKTNVSNLFKK